MRASHVVTMLAILMLSVMAPWAAAYAQTPDATEAEVDEQKDVGDAAEEEAVEEAGPPWTYQMAKMSLGLLVLLGVAIGAAWYKFVGMRQRGET